MKKSLSLLLAMAMVFTMFASVAFAADAPTPLSTQQKYDALKAKGIFDGFTDGSAGLDKPMTRAQFAKVLATLFKLPQLTTTNTYNDTNGHWAKGYIEAVSKSNPVLMEGTWTATFSPETNVKIEELATVLVRALNLTIPTTVTVTGADDWAKGYVAAAVAAGLIPAQSDYTQPALRGALVDATFVAEVKLAKPTVTASAVVNNDGTATVTGKAENSDSVKVTVGTAAAAAVTVAADGTFTFTTGKLDVGTTSISVSSYKGDVASAAVALSATVTKFGAASVTAVDSKQLKVVFNRAVNDADPVTDTASAKNVANYKVNGVALTANDAITLSDDKTTVTIKFGASGTAAMLNKTAYTITILKSLKDAAGNKLGDSDFVTDVFFSDTTKPTVTAVTATESGGIKIQFSERMGASTPTVVVNGTAIAGVTLAAEADSVTIAKASLPSLTLGNSYTVIVSDAVDLVGANTMDLYSGTVAYTISASAPSVVSLIGKDERRITLTFSEKINGATDTTDAVDYQALLGPLVVKKNNVTLPITKATTKDGKVFTIELPNTADLIYDSSKSETSVTLEVTIQGYKDEANNLGAKVIQNVTLTKDAAGPVLSKAEYNYTTNAFELTFNKDLAAGSVAVGNITLTNADGVRLTTAAGTISGKKISITNPVIGTYGTYNLSIAKDAFTDATIAANKNAQFSTSVTYSSGLGNTAKPKVTTAVGGTDSITVTFDIKVKGGVVAGSATDANNYKLNSAALPAGTFISLDAGQTVATITLPAGSTDASATKVLSVSNVQDLAGNVMDATNKAVALTDTIAPNLASAKVDASAATVKLLLTFSEDVDGKRNGPSTGAVQVAPVIGDFIVTINGVTVANSDLQLEASDDEKVVKLSPLNTNVNFATGDIVIKTANPTTGSDLANNKIKTGVSVTATR